MRRSECIAVLEVSARCFAFALKASDEDVDDHARRLFDKVPLDVKQSAESASLWKAMIGSLGRNVHGSDALRMFDEMRRVVAVDAQQADAHSSRHGAQGGLCKEQEAVRLAVLLKAHNMAKFKEKLRLLMLSE